MQLTQSLRVRPQEVIAFVGGGGKTTALFRLADELVPRGKHVIVSTTTRLAAAQLRTSHTVPLRYDASRAFLSRVRVALAEHAHILIVGQDVDEDKVAGVPPGLIDELAGLDAVDAVLYEADGARMLPFKAPAPHEPVVAASTTLLVPVVGVTALGEPLDDAHVHRAEMVAHLAGARMGEALTPVTVARVIAHPEGGLKGKPEGARAITLINQVEGDVRLAAARALARSLLGYAEIDAVAVGAVRNTQDPVREAHRRVAAIVLAAGAGTRMAGRVKQLLPWLGKTLVENAISIATQSSANETIVVLGARAEEIRAVIREMPARVILNPSWGDGQSTSIRTGLNALPPQIDAAVFVNADQPLLTAPVIDALIQRYRETDASIIVPLYAGQRGSPVLFARAHFDELMQLRGEQGGRELLGRHRVERVEFPDARLGTDVDTLEEYEELT